MSLAEVVTGWMLRIIGHPVFLVGVGGGIGSLLRYYASRWIDSRDLWLGLPWGTFVVNMIGTFILAVTALLVLERMPDHYRGAYLLIGTGFCGGLTTFSTLEWETFKLVRDGSWWLAAANVGGSFVCGFAAILSAMILVYGILGRP